MSSVIRNNLNVLTVLGYAIYFVGIITLGFFERNLFHKAIFVTLLSIPIIILHLWVIRIVQRSDIVLSRLPRFVASSRGMYWSLTLLIIAGAVEILGSFHSSIVVNLIWSVCGIAITLNLFYAAYIGASIASQFGDSSKKSIRFVYVFLAIIFMPIGILLLNRLSLWSKT